MKVVVTRVELVNLVGKIQNIVPVKPTIPILSNILIEAVDDQLILSVTDLTVSVRAYIEAKVLEEGAITLPAKRFFQLIRELTAVQVEIHAQSSEVAIVNAGSSHFRIQGMHKNEFPNFPNLSEGMQLTLPSSQLNHLLSRTSFAAARDDSKHALNGILLQNVENTIIFIGTDGKRLAKNDLKIDAALSKPGSYIIPLKAIEEIIRLLDSKEEDPATLTLMSDKIAVEFKSTTLITKLLSGQYPDVSRVIPEQIANPIALNRDELISLLRQVSLFTSENSNSVRFTFTNGELHLSAMSGSIGEGKVHMPVNYGGEKLEMAFNPNYFLDMLRHSKDESVHFSISDPYNPGLITDSTSAQFVIMPMRLEV